MPLSGFRKRVSPTVLPPFFLVFSLNWADPGVLWKKALRAMGAMRGKTLETVPFQPYFGCTKKASSKYCQTSTAKQREL